MKFAIDWCVFAYPDNTIITQANVKCSAECAGPKNSAKIALTDRLLQTNAALQYQYCKGPDINNILDDCAACLDTVPNAKALGYCRFWTPLMDLFASAELVDTRCRGIKGGVRAKTETGGDGQH
jgi:hypothetical protein